MEKSKLKENIVFNFTESLNWFLEDNSIDFKIEDNNYIIESNSDYNTIKENLEKLVDKIDLDKTSITEITFFTEKITIIDLWNERYIKIIKPWKFIKYIKEKIKNLVN